VSDKLQEIDENQDREHQEKVIQDTAGAMYLAGFDTVYHFSQSLFPPLTNYSDKGRPRHIYIGDAGQP
jgi:hypothetical protein